MTASSSGEAHHTLETSSTYRYTIHSYTMYSYSLGLYTSYSSSVQLSPHGCQYHSQQLNSGQCIQYTVHTLTQHTVAKYTGCKTHAHSFTTRCAVSLRVARRVCSAWHMYMRRYLIVVLLRECACANSAVYKALCSTYCML